MKAVKFDHYGGLDALEVVEVARPAPASGELLVRVKAAGINPGEVAIREGVLRERFPTSFPSGEGSDFAGIVEQTGAGVEFAVGAEVLGFTDRRASHAEFVVAEQDNVVRRPPGVPWAAAGALFVAGSTAYAGVRAVAVREGETVAVSAAAGGVGSLAVQLARRAGAKVIGIASAANHDWLGEHGVIALAYGEGLQARLHAAAEGRLDAFIDTFGGGYVELALALGVRAQRINTLDHAAAQQHAVRSDGSAAAASAHVLGELAKMVDAGELEVPIAHTYPLERVRDAYRELERRHTRGKIVLLP